MIPNNSSPLKEVFSYDPSLKVESRLHQTHWKTIQTEEEINLEVFSICCQLELLCKKNYCKLLDMDDTSKMEFNNRFKPHACVEIKKIWERLALLPNSFVSLKDFLWKYKMHVLLPKLWWYLQDTNKSLTAPIPIISNYFERLASLNQMKVMSQQINYDVHNLINHKYIAHQTALLYHAIADLGTFVNSHKKDVESSFADIKKSLNVNVDGQVPHLPGKEKFKLNEMTNKLMDLSTSFDNELFQPLIPVISFFITR